MSHRGTAQTFRHAARSTQDCAAICVETIEYCLEMGGTHTEPSHVRLLQDCADICVTTAGIVLRGSQSHAQVAPACADICDLCAASCERFAGDPQMKACANQCYLCAAACRQMAGIEAPSPGAASSGAAGLRSHGRTQHP